jgi:quercetin dioxygenase-like cupin family protein
MKYGKVWGETQPIFNKNNVAIHRISVNKGAMCSKHYHEHKYNMFFIESGQIKVEVWQKDYELVDQTILSSGESIEIKYGLYHRFVALEDTIAYEIYYVNLQDDDIYRIDCGSKNDK